MTATNSTPDWSAILEGAKALGLEYATNGIQGGAFRPDDSPLSGEWAGDITPADILPLVARALEFSLEGVAELEDGEIEQLADSWEDGYNSAEWPAFHVPYDWGNEPIGYQYRAAEFSPAALRFSYVENWIRMGRLSPAARDMGMEDILNQLAAAEGIDRSDEYSFDSDDFPKVILYGQ